MKGIILAGGKATRLHPVTKAVCKQMLPVYDKPMIYYPLSVLMQAGIRDILVISTPDDLPRFKDLLGNGRSLGLKLGFAIQKYPGGIAESFLIGKDFIGKERVALILGDNIFYGNNLSRILKNAASLQRGAVIFGYYVKSPGRYGVIEFDNKHNVISIEEKPNKPKSNYAVCGLYFYDNQVVDIARNLKPSARGELEITDVNNEYLQRKIMKVKLLSRGYAWLDTGTPDSLIDASLFIRTIEERQGLKVGCIEEMAYRFGFISKRQLKKIAEAFKNCYSDYLLSICQGEK